MVYPVQSSAAQKKGRLSIKKEKLFYKRASKRVVKSIKNKAKYENPTESKKCRKAKKNLKRATPSELYDNVDTMNAVMDRALEVQANLDRQFPTVIKCMLPSHVTGGYWLGLSKGFCVDHMPKQDQTVVLVDENGKTFKVKYLVEKVGLSGGWRGFSIAHNLVQGDVVVFQLIEPLKLKVYIVRLNSSDEVDGALGLLKLEASTPQIHIVKNIDMCERREDEYLALPPTTLENIQMNDHDELEVDPSENGDLVPEPSENGGSQVMNGIELAESDVQFNEVKTIEDFSIIANGFIISSALTDQVKTKYYELCCSQKAFLHEYLLQGLNCRLVAGVIAETVNIADAIRVYNVTTSPDHLLVWDKTLKAFEDMGMKVGFLRARLDKLLNLALISNTLNEAKMEREAVEEDKCMLESKLSEVNKRMCKLDGEIKMYEGRLESTLEEVRGAPW